MYFSTQIKPIAINKKVMSKKWKLSLCFDTVNSVNRDLIIHS